MLKSKRVLVTGGAGVIGRHLVQKLDEMGASLFIGDLKPKPREWGNHIQYWQGDLNYITKEELKKFAPEYVFHLAAAFERSEETYEFWEENDRHNVQLSHHIADCIKDLPSVNRVVFTSSYLIYRQDQYQFPEPQTKPVRLEEQNEIDPRNLCGVAKLLHEKELEFLAHFSEKLSTVSARIYRVYGKGSRDVISRWIRSLLNGEEITIYNKDGMFDYIYAEQVAEGLLRLAESNASGIVNLGNGKARRVSDIIGVLKQYFPQMKSKEVESNILYEASEANIDRLKEVTGWQPQVQLEDAIGEMIEFEKNKRHSIPSENVHLENVLITSVSRKVPLIKGVKKTLARFGPSHKTYGADVNPSCIGRYFVDEFWEMPRLDELSAEAFIQFCQDHHITAVIPTRDGELHYFAENKTTFESAGISIMVSNSKAIQLCMDKLLFYQEMSKKGYPVIHTAEDVRALHSEKFVVKERFGAGSQRVGLNLDQEEARKFASQLKDPLFQQYIEGKEYSIDVYVGKNGEVKGTIPRKREVVIGGESQVTTTFRDERLESLSAELVKTLGLYGHAVLQVLEDCKGNYHLIECNSRVGGASHLSWESGLDSLYWFLTESTGESLENVSFVRAATEKKLVRYAEDLIL